MRYLICKILTPEFYAKFIAQVDEEAEDRIQAAIKKEFPDGVPDTDEAKEKCKRLTWCKELHLIRIRDNYYWMWNNKKNLELKKEDLEVLSQDPLWEPRFYEEIFYDMTSGLQSHPRIMWKDKIQKIDDIDEIIASREPKDEEERKLFLKKKSEIQVM